MPSIMDIQNPHFHEDDLASFFGIGKSKEAYKIKIRELERNIRQLNVLLERKEQIKKLEQETQGTKKKDHQQSDWDDIINNKIFSPENVLNLKPGWTWYDVLCLSRNENNVETINQHWKLLQVLWHPDQLLKRRGMNLDPRMTIDSLTETIKCLGKARDILTNEAKRRAYDKEIANPSYKPERWPMPEPAPRQGKAFSNPYFVSARRNDIFERYAKVRSCPGRL
jgi:hypothetical protein